MSKTKEQVKHTVEWCAGFFEGEGWVCIGRRDCKDRPNPRIKVISGITNTEQILLAVFVTKWGGRLRSRKGTNLSKKPLFEWRLEDARAEIFLRAIHPFLIGRKNTIVKHALKVRARLTATKHTHAPYTGRFQKLSAEEMSCRLQMIASA